MRLITSALVPVNETTPALHPERAATPGRLFAFELGRRWTIPYAVRMRKGGTEDFWVVDA